MTAMSALCKIRFPTENFFKFSPYCVLPRHSHIMEHAMMGILFIEFHDLHLHLDPVLDSVYIAGSCRFRFHFFFGRYFAVPLTHPLFDPSASYIAIPLYMAHPFPPPAAVAVAAAPAASPPQAPSISFSEEEDSLEVTSSSSSSSTPGGDYTLADAGMANGFLSSESI